MCERPRLRYHTKDPCTRFLQRMQIIFCKILNFRVNRLYREAVREVDEMYLSSTLSSLGDDAAASSAATSGVPRKETQTKPRTANLAVDNMMDCELGPSCEAPDLEVRWPGGAQERVSASASGHLPTKSSNTVFSLRDLFICLPRGDHSVCPC